MDVLAELENMVASAADWDEEFEPSEEEIARWQKLFRYTHSKAVEQIKNQKNDYLRNNLSNQHWALEKSEKETSEFSREAYEHWIRTSGQSTPTHHGTGSFRLESSQMKFSYLIILDDILNTPESIQQAANLPEPPQPV